jgi:putative flavoprotein involved in K+ transport
MPGEVDPMTIIHGPERVQVVVIGGGQAGLSVGYYLRQQGLSFVILEANARVGDSWRKRWDSLRLFTPAKYDGLIGLPFPAPPHSFPTKDEMADYLESYVRHFDLPVHTAIRVDRLWRDGASYIVDAGDRRWIADHVVIAMATYQAPRVPDFARALDPGIRQLHSSEYKSPSQLRPGGVLVVGAGNSGADIAIEVAKSHRTWLAGRHPGHIPFHIESAAARFILPILFRVIFHRILTVRTPMGRQARPSILYKGGLLIRVKPEDLAAAHVERTDRVTGVAGGKPVLADGRELDVANVIWCTGYHPGLSWVDLPQPIVGEDGEPVHREGIVSGERGLYFVGLHFLYAISSTMIHGVARDAQRITGTIAARVRQAARESASGAPRSETATVVRAES